jgi:3-deoxy-7-phosphoheptulonate synthase
MNYNTLHIPEYENDSLNEVKNLLYELSPLIGNKNIHQLNQDLDLVYQNKAFILHAGDCAESFEDTVPYIIDAKLSHLLELTQEMENLLDTKVICIARQAGQYAKPRTQSHETFNDTMMLTYRGDIINSAVPTEKARKPDAKRMIEAYYHIQKILNYYENNFTQKASMYFSHESLLLHFDECMTRQNESKAWFNTSTHLLWLGMRTAFDSQAHIQYAQGIENPIALKVGPQTSLIALSKVLNYLIQENQFRKILLIYRFGIDHIVDSLPKLLNMIKKKPYKVLLLCDPMHGNTKINGHYKTRHPSDITHELVFAKKLHKVLHLPLHGLHIETTFEEVDECVEAGQYSKKYKSLVDPRLNQQQCLQLFKEFITEQS